MEEVDLLQPIAYIQAAGVYIRLDWFLVKVYVNT